MFVNINCQISYIMVSKFVKDYPLINTWRANGHDEAENHIMPRNAPTASKTREYLSSKEPAGLPKRSCKKKGASQRRKDSYTTLQSQFSALQPDEQLQFLSWLFEAAISRCRFDHPTKGGIASTTARSPELGVPSAPVHEQYSAASAYIGASPDSPDLTRK